MSKIIGIDLGTTNSVVAVMEAGEPMVIENSKVAGRLRPWSLSLKTATVWSVRSLNDRPSPTPKTLSIQSNDLWDAASMK